MCRRLLIFFLLTAMAMARPQSRTLRDQRPPVGDRPGYKLEASYPVFPSGVSPKVNQACAALLQRDLERFKQDYDGAAVGRWPWDYQARFSLVLDTPELVSVLYTVSARQDGAHPRFYFLTRAFSPRTGQPWSLRPGWLNKLSTYCIADLKKQIHPNFGSAGDAEIERGAGPDLQNFQCVLPTSKGVRVYFRTDQIGPNLLGTRIVTVPYAYLEH